MRDIEYKDILSVKDLFTNYSESRIQRMLTWRESRELTKELLNKSFRYERDAVAELKAYYTDPEFEAPEPPICDCPPANDLRWHDMPVTWAYRSFQQDLPNSAQIIRQILSDIEAVFGIRFRETTESQANIVISNGTIDGRNGTLGQAYQPASGDRMRACGPMCGNILIDADEIWTQGMYRTVMTHEILHAVGLRHMNDRRAIMFPAYLGPREMHALDIAELLKRYPLNMVELGDPTVVAGLAG